MPETDWLPAGSLAKLPAGTAAEVMVGDVIVALANVNGQIYALDGICAHQGGPLGKGALDGCTLTCPWHGWQYDAATGQQLLSQHVRQRCYPVRIEGDTIMVRLSAE
jgi:nitrite reductase/ring-hydroxylating ferredoxin subunit